MRTIVFVDGFNLYHSLDAKPEYHKYKRLNIRGLATSFLTRSHEIVDTYFFTALPTWHPDTGKIERHRKLVEVYSDMGIKVRWGVFRQTVRECKICQSSYIAHEEKRTDVNIAVAMLDLAYQGAYDTACLISGDSDLIPGISKVRERFPATSFRLIIPIGRMADELKRACGGSRCASQITNDHLARNQLPNPFAKISDPTRMIYKPYSWS